MTEHNISTNEVSGLIRAGRAAIRVGDYEAALATFERAIQLDPANRDAQDGLRDAQRRLDVQAQSPSEEQIEYCYRHPETETALHCTSCGRPICFRCSTPGAVGQLCPECLKGRRSPNYQVSATNIIYGGAVGLLVTILVATLIGVFLRGFFFLIILFFVGPAVAEFIVRSVDRVTRNKRGRPMQITVAVAMILGGLLSLFVIAPLVLGILPNFLSIALFLVIGVSTAVARLR